MGNRDRASRHCWFQGFVCIAVGLIAVAPLHAAIPQTSGIGAEKQHTEKGVNPNQLYFAVGGAEVDAFNFNLMIRMSEQVGFGLPVDGVPLPEMMSLSER